MGRINRITVRLCFGVWFACVLLVGLNIHEPRTE
jgi:hypothetical protein